VDFLRRFVPRAGPLFYRPDIVDQYRRAARCVDRIPKGADPAGRPIFLPIKFDLVINLTTAKTLDERFHEIGALHVALGCRGPSGLAMTEARGTVIASP
jgi:hypothetical protein